ncbi:hypothetical protein C1646_692064 [Rhizophagus diaphanus]|nr:hypothetical protein C1646_692064 [Rhizophagus diaphanus] [Rhizophagus sp. MUCL 43196]
MLPTFPIVLPIFQELCVTILVKITVGLKYLIMHVQNIIRIYYIYVITNTYTGICYNPVVDGKWYKNVVGLNTIKALIMV